MPNFSLLDPTHQGQLPSYLKTKEELATWKSKTEEENPGFSAWFDKEHPTGFFGEDLNEKTIVDSGDVRDEFVEDQQALEGFVGDEPDKKTVVAPKPEDKPTGVLDDEERAVLGVDEEPEDPEITRLKGEVESYDTELNSIVSELDNLRVSAKDISSSMIENIKTRFEQRRSEMTDINKRQLESMRVFGIRGGTARYSPLTATGMLSDAEKQGFERITALDTQEQGLILEAQQAADDKDFQLLHTKTEIIKEVRREKIAELKELQDIAAKRNIEIKEEKENLQNQSLVVGAVNEGSYNTADIFAALKGTVSLDKITESLDFLLEDEVIGGEEIIDKFTDVDGNRTILLRDKITGEIKSLQVGEVERPDEGARKTEIVEYEGRRVLMDSSTGEVIKDLGAWEDELEVLSVSEAKSLGVPYGTTKAEATAMGITPTTEPSKPASYKEWELAGRPGKYAEWIGSQKGVSPEVVLQIDKLAKEFDKTPIVKQFDEVFNKKTSIDSIIENGVSGPRDLALVFEFMKALDPTSVVRESEYDSASKAGNIFMGVWAKFNGYMREEGGMLPESVKEEFKAISQEKFEVIEKQYKNLRGEYSKKIDRKTGSEDGLDYLTEHLFDMDEEAVQEDVDYINSLDLDL